MATPCTIEVIELTKKALKSFSDGEFKEASLRCCLDLVTCRPVNLSLYAAEAVKVALRALNVLPTQERSASLKLLGAQIVHQCLLTQPKPAISSFDQIFHSCSKAMEESRSTIYSDLLSALVQIEINVQTDLRQASPKRVSGPPQNLIEAVSMLSGIMLKTSISLEGRVGAGIALKHILVQVAPTACQTVTDLGLLMDSLVSIGSKSLGNEVDNWRNSELVCWVTSCVLVDAFSETQRQQVLDYLLNKLSTLRNARPEDIENKRPSSATDYQATVCLRLFEPLATSLSENALKSYGDSLYQPLLDFMSSWRHSKYTTRALAALTYRVHSTQCNLVFKILSLCTIAHAEIAALKVGSVARNILAECINNLFGYCLALGNALKAVSSSGITENILIVALGTAKSLLSLQYQPENIEEQSLTGEEGIPMECDYARREGGWLIIEGIVRMQGQWVSSQVPLLLSLWKLPFGKKTCIFEYSITASQLVFELRHKRVASSSLVAFMKSNPSLLSPSVCKVLATFLANALQFLEPLQDRGQRKQMFQDNCSPIEILILKNNVFQCLVNLPLQTYVSRYVPLLHSICGELVSDRLTGYPNIYRDWMTEDDLIFDDREITSPLYDLSPQLYQEGAYDTWLGLPLQARFEFPFQRSSLLINVLNSAIKLFSELFTSASINLNNRLQLFKHLHVHVLSATKLRDSSPLKLNKQVTILVACLGCLKRLRDMKGVIKDAELIDTLKGIISALEGSPHALVKKLHSLLAIYLCKSIPEQNYIQRFLKYQFLREIEQRATLSDYNPLVKGSLVSIVGHVYAHFEFSQIESSQQSMGHIIQNSTRDERVGCWGIYALYQAYQRHSDRVVNIVKATYPLAFHHYVNEEYADVLAYQSLVQLSCLALRVEKNKKDPVYQRALALFHEGWQQRAKTVWLQLPRLIQSEVQLDLGEVAAVAIENISMGLGVLQALVDLGYGSWLLTTQPSICSGLLSHYDTCPDPSPSLETVLRSLCVLLWKSSQSTCMSFLQSVIMSVDIQRTEVATGMSAQDERRDMQQTDSTLSVAHRYHHSTKLFCCHLLLFLVKIDAEKISVVAVVDDLMRLGGFLCASEDHEFKIIGMKTFTVLYRHMAGTMDPAEPGKPYLSMFEAHIQAAIRPYLTNADPVLIVASTKLLEVVVASRTLQDEETISRLTRSVLQHIPMEVTGRVYSVPAVEGYSETAACAVHYTRLLVLCKLSQGGLVNSSVFQPCLQTVLTHVRAVATDMCVILTQDKAKHELAFGRHIVPVDIKYLGEIEVLLEFLSAHPDSSEELLAFCVALLFFPYSTHEPEGFHSQKAIDRFVRRRTSLLSSIKRCISAVSTDKIAQEVIMSLSLVSKDPSLATKSEVLELCKLILPQVTDVHTVREVEKLVLKLHVQYAELRQCSMQAWSVCVKQYVSFLNADVLDEYSDMESFKHSIFDFCKEALSLSLGKELEDMLLFIWAEVTDQELKRAVCEDCLTQVWGNWPLEESVALVMRVFRVIGPSGLGLLRLIVGQVRTSLTRHDRRSALIMDFLSADRDLLSYFSKEILSIFTLQKEEEFNEDESLVFSEAIKIVLLVYKYGQNKDALAMGILPLLFSAFYKHTPVPLLKAVTQALQYLISASPLACREFLGQLPEHEKNYLKEVLSKKTETDSVSAGKTQGMIQLKIKKF